MIAQIGSRDSNDVAVKSKTVTQRASKDDARLGRIETQLRKREAGFWARTFVKFITGFPVLFIGPVLVGAILNALLIKAQASWNPGWLVLIGIGCLIVIPILFFVEIRHRGDYFLDQARSYHTPGETYTSAWSYTDGPGRGNSEEVGAAYTEILLFAPRQIVDAFSDIRQRTPISSDELHRAAEIVLALHTADGGVALIKLRRADEAEESFDRILRYLQFYDWTDLSKDGKRTWLCSPAKKWLAPPR